HSAGRYRPGSCPGQSCPGRAPFSALLGCKSCAGRGCFRPAGTTGRPFDSPPHREPGEAGRLPTIARLTPGVIPEPRGAQAPLTCPRTICYTLLLHGRPAPQVTPPQTPRLPRADAPNATGRNHPRPPPTRPTLSQGWLRTHHADRAHY